MPCTESFALSAGEGRQLLQLAQDAIGHRLENGSPGTFNLGDYPENLSRPAACFVTLKREGRLRGCIGTLEFTRPLLENVIEYACAAAFYDPRFQPLAFDEWDGLSISLSVLGEPISLQFNSTAELAGRLRPMIDGVILEAHSRRAVFLPQVWKSLPEPGEFLRQLKFKARLPTHIEPPALTAKRFAVTYISEELEEE